MHPLNSILRNFLKDLDLESGLRLTDITKKWDIIVGQTIAAHASPYVLKGDTLTLIVDTPHWMHHLSFYKGEISSKLKKFNVKEIRFKLGRLPQKTRKGDEIYTAALTDSDSRYIEDTLKGIKDKELKEKLRLLLKHGITKGKPKI
jgi:hypothetical protein